MLQPPSPAALYLYQFEPPALVRVEGDQAVPLHIPAGCSVAGLYASPGAGALVVELVCANGPVSMRVGLADGTLTPLLRDDTMDSHFLAWAADGRSVYLRVNSLADPQVVRVAVSSLHLEQIPIDAYTYDLEAAPGGRQIVFSLSHGLGLGSEMWLADADGQGAHLLLASRDHILGLARWSPDGKHIAFMQIPDSQTPYAPGELWVIEADGSDPRKLAQADAGHGYAAAWSPDGRRLAFVARSNPEDQDADQSLDALVSNIVVANVAGRELTQITHTTRGRVEAPAWSPDGNTLQFAYVLDGRMELQNAELTNGTVRPLLVEAACCPVWLRK